MNSIKGKSLVLLIVVFFIGLMIVGGTLAFMMISANITNTNYVGLSTCFLVDYNIDNGDNTQDITGILFPSLGPSGGLSGRVGLKIASSCSVNGTGTLKLHINNTTDSHIMEKATSHCEDKKTGDILTEYSTESSCSSAGAKWKNYPVSYCEDNTTLRVMKDYTTSGSCTSHNGTWVTNGSPLKYAVYNSNNTNANPIRVGHITSSSIGSDVTIYDDIILTHEQRYFYIYIWLDGYLTDNTHVDLPFDAYVKVNAIQSDRLLPIQYQQVDYLKSTGTQYINTGYIPSGNDTVKCEFSIDSLTGVQAYQAPFGTRNSDGTTNNAFAMSFNSTKIYPSCGAEKNTDNVFAVNGSKYVVELSKDSFIIDGETKLTSFGGTKNFSYPFLLFARNRNDGAGSFLNGKIYSLQLYNNGGTIYNFIPCYRVSDGVRGMYDTVNNKFYVNAGSGTFEIPS